MPKGHVEQTTNISYGITCHIKGTTRLFTTEKEKNTYLRRHNKVCDCGKNGRDTTGMVYDYASRQAQIPVVNTLRG
jgi:hypothetical protein